MLNASTANVKNSRRTPIAGSPNVVHTNTSTSGVLRTTLT